MGKNKKVNKNSHSPGLERRGEPEKMENKTRHNSGKSGKSGKKQKSGKKAAPSQSNEPFREEGGYEGEQNYQPWTFNFDWQRTYEPPYQPNNPRSFNEDNSYYGHNNDYYWNNGGGYSSQYSPYTGHRNFDNYYPSSRYKQSYRHDNWNNDFQNPLFPRLHPNQRPQNQRPQTYNKTVKQFPPRSRVLPPRPGQKESPLNLEEKNADLKRKREQASRVAQDIMKKKSIADRANKLRDILKNRNSLSATSTIQEEENEDRADEQVNRQLPTDFSLTEEDYRAIGTGKDVSEDLHEDMHLEDDVDSPVVFHDIFAYDGLAQEMFNEKGNEHRDRIAKQPLWMTNPECWRRQHRKRSLSESLARSSPKRPKQVPPSADPPATAEDPAIAVEYEKIIGKLKSTILKKDRGWLKSMVDHPQSTGKLLVAKLIEEHRSQISDKLSELRFNPSCSSTATSSTSSDPPPPTVSDLSDIFNNSSDEVDLRNLPHAFLEGISNLIKKEIPDICAEHEDLAPERNDVCVERRVSCPEPSDSRADRTDICTNETMAIKEGEPEDIKEDFDEAVDEVIEVPVPPKPPAPVIDLDDSIVEEGDDWQLLAKEDIRLPQLVLERVDVYMSKHPGKAPVESSVSQNHKKADGGSQKKEPQPLQGSQLDRMALSKDQGKGDAAVKPLPNQKKSYGSQKKEKGRVSKEASKKGGSSASSVSSQAAEPKPRKVSTRPKQRQSQSNDELIRTILAEEGRLLRHLRDLDAQRNEVMERLEYLFEFKGQIIGPPSE